LLFAIGGPFDGLLDIGGWERTLEQSALTELDDDAGLFAFGPPGMELLVAKLPSSTSEKTMLLSGVPPHI
jgi:hypothetical protein